MNPLLLENAQKASFKAAKAPDIIILKNMAILL